MQQSFLLIETTHGYKDRDYCLSQYNAKHQCLVLCFLRHLQQSVQVSLPKVTVLTPYVAQGNVYRTSLAQLHLDNPSAGYNQVMIKTIDSFQGRETDMVLYNTTATIRPGYQKFSGRLNITLSRARAAMYLIINMGQ
ncbi:hypothetical protein BO79DRAFT_254859 [Aspergillus costaricaensis CBS 115574]|uniref:Uncharacterized protein n=1 Tax=Aspergillus costaricaensis CBS 115574 TaxID=1448317 RepID=A0ACD1IG95_9EURO|nr:hypothetical protein BO79DRAFT_254859 [Aspergillus costaricaensis CBS 115574]RAK88796.1 hypothetical protein BO79DRAFT_254859 [Aspergillus costaricaensis CBS 115574]